jgi:hypothetical protein
VPIVSRRTGAIAFAEAMREFLPVGLADAERLANETVQITAWLVGLAGSVVAVVIAKPAAARSGPSPPRCGHRARPVAACVRRQRHRRARTWNGPSENLSNENLS